VSCFGYGVATVSMIDKIIGLFCRILSLLYGSFAKETYNFIDPTNQSHPIIWRYISDASESKAQFRHSNAGIPTWHCAALTLCCRVL